MKRRGLSILAFAAVLPIAGSGRGAPGDPGPAMDPALAMAAMDRRIADLDTEQQSQRQELGRVGEELAARHARVLTRGRAFYRLTRAGLLPVGGGFDALVTHAMHVERARRALAADIDDERRLRGRAAEIARQLDRIARERGALSTQRTSMEAARELAQDEQRRQAAFDRAFETSTGPAGAPSGYVSVTGGGALSPEAPAGGFATARGHLLFPVSGRAEMNPGKREGSEGDGLEIRAPAGSPVRAVFAGRVAFADRYGPYGRLVILDHGDHYYSVSGNLNEIAVKIGQEVSAGEPIGTVGDEGRGSML
ncbi:MAG: peptidoglycan DD-metalloendopeptidase family protein, partial [Myxococcales bacterium]|nr:peptidoglycan DD-metalloendopeptidase family protein [Myxococcales bacterium]